MNIVELLNKRISDANIILLSVSQMKAVPSAFLNVIAYPQDSVNYIRHLIIKWQLTTKEVLISFFGESHRYVKGFEKTVTDKSRGFDYKEEFKTELSEGIALLQSIVEIQEFGINNKEDIPEEVCKKKGPKIFISHKNEDKPFVKELIKLLEFIVGNDENKIFCSSIAGYDIKPGRDILEDLKTQFQDYEIYFIVVHSPRYYQSPICLNEMGAAWVLGTKFCSFLTSDCSYNMLKGAIDNRYISIKINDEQETVVSKLNSFKDDLLKFFSVDKINNNRWENVRNEFIEKTCKIKYEKTEDEDISTSGNSNVAKAVIVAEVINTSPAMIDISNQGDGTAENLSIKLDNICKDMIVTGLDLFPVEYLKKGKHVRLNWYRCIGDPDKFDIFFTWKENGVEYSSKELVFA